VAAGPSYIIPCTVKASTVRFEASAQLSPDDKGLALAYMRLTPEPLKAEKQLSGYLEDQKNEASSSSQRTLSTCKTRDSLRPQWAAFDASRNSPREGRPIGTFLRDTAFGHRHNLLSACL
jgi:hypothetical protein